MAETVIISAVAGVGGTGLGGLIALFLGRGKGVQSILFSITAGIMLAIVCFELIPSSLVDANVFLVCVAVVLGAIAIYILEELFSKKDNSKTPLFLVAIAIALHNVPEGIALGAGSEGLVFSALSFLIGLHNVPEGMAVALPYVQSGKRIKGVVYSAFSGFPTVIGAVIGVMFKGISPLASALSLAFAGGAMIFVVFSELIPRSNDLLKVEFSGIILTIGIILGLIVINSF